MQAELKEGTKDIMGNSEHKEGRVARNIEQQTAKLPSDVFLWASVGSMATSMVLKIAGRRHDALFVGQWAAPFLLLGIYNKLVKLAGHDKEDQSSGASDGRAIL